MTAKKAKAQPETALVLRTCDKDGRSYNGFQWPSEGPVSCPDWDPTPRCGGGLHGLLWGEGDGSLLSWAVVVFCGDRATAAQYVGEHGGAGRAIVSGTATIQIRWWDARNERHRTATGYVGEDGIEANAAYRLNAKHEFVRVEQP